MSGEPGADATRVRERLLGRERLGADDDERAGRIELGREVGELRAVHVRHEVATQQARIEWRERRRRHGRPKVAAADADMDDVREPRAARAGPASGMHVGDEGRALPAHGEDLGVQRRDRGRKRSARGCAQERVQGRAALGVVDRLAGEQRPDARVETALLRELDECTERGRVETLPAEVEQQAAGLAREILETARVRGEELADGRSGEAHRVARESLSQGS